MAVSIRATPERSLVAASLPVEKRDLFLRRVSSRLELYGRRAADQDVDEAARSALTGLLQQVEPV